MAKPGALSQARVLTPPWHARTEQTSQTAPGLALPMLNSAAIVGLLVLATFSFAGDQVPDCTPGKLSDYESPDAVRGDYRHR